MKKYLQKLGEESYKASLEKVDTIKKNKVLLKFSYLLKKNINKILRQNKTQFIRRKGFKIICNCQT